MVKFYLIEGRKLGCLFNTTHCTSATDFRKICFFRTQPILGRSSAVFGFTNQDNFTVIMVQSRNQPSAGSGGFRQNPIPFL